MWTEDSYSYEVELFVVNGGVFCKQTNRKNTRHLINVFTSQFHVSFLT